MSSKETRQRKRAVKLQSQQAIAMLGLQRAARYGSHRTKVLARHALRYQGAPTDALDLYRQAVQGWNKAYKALGCSSFCR